MGRLKKDHSNWKTQGLWKKYQHPMVDEQPKKNSKKDTKKWCRGKVGVEHDWHRYQKPRFDWHLDDWWNDPWIRVECQECKKKMYKRLAKAVGPLHLFIKDNSESNTVEVRTSQRS